MSDGFLRKFLAGHWEPSEVEMHAYLDHLISPAGAGGKEVVAFLAALAARPLVAASIRSFVSYIRRTAPQRRLSGVERAVNIVGTGGGPSTFNISTSAAFVACAAGARVLKSGARAYTSRSGAMDVLRELGVALPADSSELAAMIREVGIGFASDAHGAPILRRLAVSVHPLSWRDVGAFVNTVGPLLCPFETAGQVIGIAREEHFDAMADAIRAIERQPTLLVRSRAGLDELCSFTENRAAWGHGEAPLASVTTDGLGFASGDLRDLAGGDPRTNAAIVRGVVNGTITGPARETVVLNASAALLVAGVVPTLADGVARAAEAIDRGAAYDVLQRAVTWRPAPLQVSA